jgi:hypothetical protein
MKRLINLFTKITLTIALALAGKQVFAMEPGAAAAKEMKIGELLSAIATGDVEQVETALTAVDYMSMIKHHDGKNMGDVLLARAVKLKNPSIIECLLKHGADINQQNGIGYTELMMAACDGHLQIVQCLVEHGADINIKTYNTHYTALSLAVLRHQHEVADYLLSHLVKKQTVMMLMAYNELCPEADASLPTFPPEVIMGILHPILEDVLKKEAKRFH